MCLRYIEKETETNLENVQNEKHENFGQSPAHKIQTILLCSYCS